MRRKTLFTTEQHTLPFARHEIWRRIPEEQRGQCGELCEELLRAVLQGEEDRGREEVHGRQDSRRTS